MSRNSGSPRRFLADYLLHECDAVMEQQGMCRCKEIRVDLQAEGGLEEEERRKRKRRR